MAIKKSIISLILLCFIGVTILHDFLPHVHIDEVHASTISHHHHGQDHSHEHKSPEKNNEDGANETNFLLVLFSIHVENPHSPVILLAQSELNIKKKVSPLVLFSDEAPCAVVDNTLYRKKHVDHEHFYKSNTILSDGLRAPPLA